MACGIKKFMFKNISIVDFWTKIGKKMRQKYELHFYCLFIYFSRGKREGDWLKIEHAINQV